MCFKSDFIVFALLIAIVLKRSLLVKCGRVKRVVGAVEVECGTQPRVASLKKSTTQQHLCGAVVVTPQFAMTVAHCVKYTPDQYILQLNNYCVEDDGLPPKAGVLEIMKHPRYDEFTRAHDIALLRIALNLNDTDWLTDTILPTNSFGISGECTIYGYGYRDVDISEISEKMLAGTLRIVSLDECLQALGPYVAPGNDDGMMCAVGDGVDACQGDSGGPLICSGGTVQGLSSYGMGCAIPGLPGVYVSIGPHLSWIKTILEQY